jgi:translation elongation factor EF-Tu-like GTPase
MALDWDAIERDYSGGTMTPAEIGEKYGVTKSYVNQQAKKRGWTRDLSKAVRRRTRQILATDEAKSEKDRERIEEQAHAQVSIIRAHKSELRKQSDRVRRLGELLDKQLDRAEKDTFISAAKVHALAQLQASLSNALTKLVDMERKTFAIDEPEPESDAAVTAAIDEARTIEQRAIDIRRFIAGADRAAPQEFKSA